MLNEPFQFEQQWCMIHYPKKPNGFAIFIIGDEQHFVNESTSFWIENKGRAMMISKFTEKGYLVFYSNLFGENWGNSSAVKHVQSLYQLIIRQVILNNKIHILAEGMGALVAIKLIPVMKESIRSLLFISPCISLEAHIKQEQGRKFFYKKLLREIQIAYDLNEEKCLEMVQEEDTSSPLMETRKALCILQRVDNNSYKSQNETIKQIIDYRNKEKIPTKFHYIFSDNQINMTTKMISFLTNQENEL